MASGNIIFLNGTSSAGKTSIARMLQQLLDEPYLRIGYDLWIDLLPDRYLRVTAAGNADSAHSSASEGFVIKVTSAAPGAVVVGWHVAPVGHRLMSGLHHCIATLSRFGNHVIVDHALFEPAWLEECVALLGNLPVLFVGVRCPLPVVEQRERERAARGMGGRFPGQARAQFNVVHAPGLYDLEVDTSILSPQACALAIMRCLYDGPLGAAFRQLRRRYPLVGPPATRRLRDHALECLHSPGAAARKLPAALRPAR